MYICHISSLITFNISHYNDMFQFHCVDISLAPLADFFTYYVILIFEVRIIFPLWVLTGAPERKLRLTFDSHSLIFFFF